MKISLGDFVIILDPLKNTLQELVLQPFHSNKFIAILVAPICAGCGGGKKSAARTGAVSLHYYTTLIRFLSVIVQFM